MSGPAQSPVVLMLHGQPGGASDWSRVRAALGERVHAIAFERPGWDGRRPAVGLAENARAAVEALDAAGAERATVVGHSFGGAVACRLAIDYPDRVGVLLLAAPAANCASLMRLDRWLATPVLGELAGAGLMGTMGVAIAAPPVRDRIVRALGLDEGYLASMGRRLLAPSRWLAFSAEQRTLVRELPALERRLGEIAAPTIVVAGRRDRVVPLAAQRRLVGQIPGSELVLLDGADHMLPLRRAGELAELILGVSG